ncbi:MAG TPA: efflux RND transporter periplasmic adaptor subunit [Mucilaginibacter sp.]|jgi:RND family efflux transporter MFP subunit
MKYRSYLIITVGGLFAACSGNQKPADLTAAAKQTDSKYQLSNVVEKALSSSARLPGRLIPFNEVNIYPKVNGFVKGLYVDRGSIVKKGQLLVVLEAPEMESQLQSANSRYVQAQENAEAGKEKYERLKEAAKEPGSVSPLDLDNARSQMKAEQAMAQSERSNVESVKAMLGYLRIYAPFDGMIIQRNVSPGALVAPGKTGDQPILILQDIHKMRLTVDIPEDYVDKVDLTQPVSFTFNALPGQVQTAKISRSANSLGNMQQEAIEIDVLNKNGQLKPGMYAEVRVPMLSGAKSLLVPNNAIVRSTEHEYVVKDSSGKAILVNIKEGLVSNDSTEVFGDLKANDKVVLHASDEIKQGDNI